MNSTSSIALRSASVALVAALGIGSLGCSPADSSAFGATGSTTTSAGTTGGGGSSAGGATPGQGSIAIYVQGDLVDPGFADGLAGQTPTDYQIALSRYQVLRAADDPAPVLCFDHGQSPVVSDMARDNLVGTCQTQAMPSGVYTHGRTKVDWVRYTVEGTYHSGKFDVPGKFTFLRAYSDTTYAGKPYKAGKGSVTFVGAVTSEYPLDYPAPVDAAGVHFDLTKGELTMTFAFGKALPIAQADTNAHWARFNWKIFEAFRWADGDGMGFKDGVWDVAPGGGEAVLMYGFSGYYVTSSVD